MCETLDRNWICKPSMAWLENKSLEELDIDEFETIYLKFQSTNGLVVKEVTKDSPAYKAGICVGDVVTSCNRTSLSSPPQFARVLFRSVESNRGNLITAEKRETVKVQLFVKRVADGTQENRLLHVESFTPPVSNIYELAYSKSAASAFFLILI
ncbi:uncharacterized protein LOC141621061 [Silene latifolia]|uniref:uncharacterized protein LOC141621061 n=1 Tax=Silene latifolia TaxID=37657 RepID=UPI003D76C1DB